MRLYFLPIKSPNVLMASWLCGLFIFFCFCFRYKAALLLPESHFGETSNDFSLDDVKCQGSEVSLLDCLRNTGNDKTCGDTLGAGVVCAKSQSQQAPATLGYQGKVYLCSPNVLSVWRISIFGYTSSSKICHVSHRGANKFWWNGCTCTSVLA